MVPLSLLPRGVHAVIRPGGNVPDLFSESGSTLTACEQTGWRGLLMESDALYYSVIVHRRA